MAVLIVGFGLIVAGAWLNARLHELLRREQPSSSIVAHAIPTAPMVLPERRRVPVPMTVAFAVPVLMYHRISDLTPQEAKSPLLRDLTVSPTHFEEQMKYLVDHGFTFLLASDVEVAVREHRPLPERAVAITMDDFKRKVWSGVSVLQRRNERRHQPEK